jgi:sulfide:quinone oxidoreductase
MASQSLTATFAVGPQIVAGDVPRLAAEGFRSIICNRPDGEGADHPGFAEVAAACRDAGLEAVYLPVVSGKVSDEDAGAFGALLDRLPKPTLAYCRTGTRAATLWSLSEAARGRPMGGHPGGVEGGRIRHEGGCAADRERWPDAGRKR